MKAISFTGVWLTNMVRWFLNMYILGSIVVSIPACHAGDPGSIPGRGVLLSVFLEGGRRSS